MYVVISIGTHSNYKMWLIPKINQQYGSYLTNEVKTMQINK